jgi:hypothetical protein
MVSDCVRFGGCGVDPEKQGGWIYTSAETNVSEKFMNCSATFAIRYNRAQNVLVVVALWLGQSTATTRHEARACIPHCLIRMELCSRKPCHLHPLIRAMDKSITPSIRPLVWPRVLSPIVQQLRHWPPHELACEWVVHPLGRIHRCARVLTTNLPHLRLRCLHNNGRGSTTWDMRFNAEDDIEARICIPDSGLSEHGHELQMQ